MDELQPIDTALEEETYQKIEPGEEGQILKWIDGEYRWCDDQSFLKTMTDL